MATKPTESFTYATDATFTSAPDTGNPTKVNPPGWPVVAQGEVPALGVVAAFTNKIRNVLGQWTGWLLAGSSAGAADAHIVETAASGAAKVAMLDLSQGPLVPDTNNQTLDPADGNQQEVTAATAGRQHDLVAAGTAGRWILIQVTAFGAGANATEIRRSGFSGGNTIVTFTSASWACALLRDDGTNWRLGMCFNATPGADA